jgi:hypothetical protein
VLRAVWAVLPFTAGPGYADALAELERSAEVTGAVGLWTLWAVGLTLTLVPHWLTLAPMRVLAPGSFAAAVVATIATGATSSAVAALTTTAAAGAVSLAPQIGAWFVNGSSYGDERRIPLRPPAPLLLGPIPLAWAVVAATALSAPLLLASGRWILGAVVAVCGGALSFYSVAALQRLARRWLVFVPAGVVIHDLLTMADPVLIKRNAVERMGPALQESTATDLTMGALGLALELRLSSPAEMAVRPRPNHEPELMEVDAVLVSPSMPGAVLDEADRRRMRVG